MQFSLDASVEQARTDAHADASAVFFVCFVFKLCCSIRCLSVKNNQQLERDIKRRTPKRCSFYPIRLVD